VVLAIALPWLPAKGVDVAVADPGLAARVAGLAAAVALYAVLGTGLGALLCHQFAAVVAGLLLWQGGIEDLVVGVLGRPGLGRWLPGGAAAALTAPGDATLAMWAGALVLAAYGLVPALVGGRLVVSRDLT
jgi:ABC-2 type transport system permease protein